MRIFRKKQRLINDRLQTSYCIGPLPILSVEASSSRKRLYLLGLKFFSKRYLAPEQCQHCSNKKLAYLQTKKIDQTRLIIWFDHCLGGGTEVYSNRTITSLVDNYNVLRIQYIWIKGCFRLTFIRNEDAEVCYLFSLADLREFLLGINFIKIVVNNLVGYKDSLEILKLISELKAIKAKNFDVIFNLHDYHCICPNYNLIYVGKEYCCLDFKKCKECFPLIRLSEKPLENRILMSGARNPHEWRSVWGEFFEKDCDKIVTFSKGSRDILLKAYPFSEGKVEIKPHNVPKVRSVEIPKHTGLNIAFLGEIGLRQKGREIVRQISESLGDHDGIKLFVIGEYKNPPKGLSVTGRYQLSNLPSIVEKLKIDIIMIPSIWPETFSFTTSEAIQLNIPVACFDYGAQAEKVRASNRGLILSDHDPKNILSAIKNHLTEN